MPLELQIIQASEFVQLNPQGHFDLTASKDALTEIARACRKRGIERAMIDLRTVRPGPEPVFTPTDIAELVATYRDVGFTPHHRLAILYYSDPHRRARLFAFLSTMHGWSVQAFGSFEKALFWLSHSEPSESQAAAGKQVPVRFADRETKAPALSRSRRFGRKPDFRRRGKRLSVSPPS